MPDGRGVIAEAHEIENTAQGVRGSTLSDYFREGTPFTINDLRRGILEHSIVKTLGDFGQVLSVVTENGGYIEGPFYAKTLRPKKKLNISYIIGPTSDGTIVNKINGETFPVPIPISQGRIGIHDDQPAAATGIYMTMFGTQGISDNTMTLATKSEKDANTKITTKSLYGASRGLRAPATYAGGKKKKTKRAQKKKRNTRGKKQTKPMKRTKRKQNRRKKKQTIRR